MFVGPVAIGTTDEWLPSPGSVVSWHASAASRAKVREAPVSDVPVSYMQAQHLRGYCEQTAKGLDYSRLLIVTCDVPGRCDTRAMTYVINAHLRRHDTYRSWFEYHDVQNIVRHAVTDPADIEFVPTKHGEMTSSQLRDLASSTPDPLQWDCFSFGVIQYPDRFTVYLSIDHLHMDATFVGMTLMELYTMYFALVSGGAPIALPDAGSYAEFCVRQHKYLSELTAQSPQVRAWTEYAQNNNGSFPQFPLPLGDTSVPCRAAVLTEIVMDDRQTARFETRCVDGGARFIGGILACIARAEHDITGADTYYGLTPSDTRRTSEDFMTMGWFTGLIPITVPIAGTSFDEAARAAQASFDSGRDMVDVPFYRVLELAPGLSWPRPDFPVVNYMDAGAPPLSALLTTELESMKLGIYADGRYSYQLTIFVVRLDNATAVTAIYPENPVARESILRYIAAVKSACVRIADDHDAVPIRAVARA